MTKNFFKEQLKKHENVVNLVEGDDFFKSAFHRSMVAVIIQE